MEKAMGTRESLLAGLILHWVWKFLDRENLGKALASFQRILLIGNTRIDRFRAGEAGALNDGERHGLWLWESKARCAGRQPSKSRRQKWLVQWGCTSC